MNQKAYVIHWVRVDRYPSAELAYHDGKKQLNAILSMIHNDHL